MKQDFFNSKVVSAAIISVGIIVLGLCIQTGIDNFTNKDRKVVVKGLAEKEVQADKVTWPIVSKELGNDLPTLYQSIGHTQAKITRFLKGYRYNITSIITVTSRNVAKVRELIARQGELLKDGIAIVDGDYDNKVRYEYVSFKSMKPKMMEEAIANAEVTAQQFAKSSKSSLGKIVSADQGQFSIDDRDSNPPYIKKVRVVTTVTYSLRD